MNKLTRRFAPKSKLALTLTLSSLFALSISTNVFADKPKAVPDTRVVPNHQMAEPADDKLAKNSTTGESVKSSEQAPAAKESVDQIVESKSSNAKTEMAPPGVATDEVRAESTSVSAVAGDTVAGVEEKKERAAAILGNQAAEHYELGQHYMHKFDWEMSEVEMEAAIMCSPTLKAAHRDYCVVSLFRGQPMRSLAEFMMVVGLGDPIALNEQEKAALIKKAARLHYQKGINYGVLHEWKKATPEFIAALGYTPNSAAIAHSLAFSYAAAGDFELAEAEYLKAFALDPTNSYSHADFAMMLSEHGDHKKAMEELAKAIALSPGVAALHVDMAWLAESNGDLKTAETEFHQAVQLSPKHAGLWSHLGRVEERLGKAKDARSAYSEALAVDPGDDEAKARLAALNKSAVPASGAETPVGPIQSKKPS